MMNLMILENKLLKALGAALEVNLKFKNRFLFENIFWSGMN
jgi:hypothetical protein